MRSSAFAALLQLSQVFAGTLSNAGVLDSLDTSMEITMKQHIETIIDTSLSASIHRRRDTPATNLTAWNTQTQSLCTTALSLLHGQASNPSGMAVCYNLPYLDNNSGEFKADLRLYKISEPMGVFADIPSQDVQVSLEYEGATVSVVNASSLESRDEFRSSGLESRVVERQAEAPVLAQAYEFVGQINKDLNPASMNLTTLRRHLTPSVSLLCLSSSGSAQNTTLSTLEASFVTGVFSSSTTNTTTTNPSPAPMQTLVVPPGTTFALPGTKILIAPVGAVITGVWAMCLMATIGWGTWGRYRFRDLYRRALERARRRAEKGFEGMI